MQSNETYASMKLCKFAAPKECPIEQTSASKQDFCTDRPLQIFCSQKMSQSIFRANERYHGVVEAATLEEPPPLGRPTEVALRNRPVLPPIGQREGRI